LGGALDSHDISRMVWLQKKFVPGALRAGLSNASHKYGVDPC